MIEIGLVATGMGDGAPSLGLLLLGDGEGADDELLGAGPFCPIPGGGGLLAHSPGGPLPVRGWGACGNMIGPDWKTVASWQRMS